MQRISASFLPPIALDVKSETPMYHQLSDWFRRAILDGQLRPGQRVPSSRNLATELKISRVPVLSAYEQLYAEGYLETFVGAGTCVARSIPDETLKPANTKSRSAPSETAGQPAPRRTSRRAALMHAPAQSWLNNLGAFRVGVPALDHFPAGVWSKLVNRHSRQPRDTMVYGDPMGYLPFREAIAEYLGAVRAVRCDASQILVTTGSQQGLQIAAHVLLDPKERVWMEEPGYPGAHQAFTTAGAQMIPVPVDQEGLDVPWGIRRGRAAHAVYVTPSHQFPLGTTLSATRRMQLLSWAVHNGAWIIEDDYDSEYRFGGRPIASLQGLDTDARVIYVGTFSKVMFPSLRLGYVVVPKDLVPAFSAVRDAADTFSSTLYQVVMTDFIREGHFARHIRRMRVLYMERRATLVEAIANQMGDRLEVIGAEAGMQLVALLPHGVDDEAVARKAAKVGVSARPLSRCYLNPPARGGLILGYGGANTDEIREGIRKLKTCF
ncbi:PLP-dependent aminotransferase family protein [Rhodanobacter sp. MP7CTX1]|uniref:MocR-like pyridoxine biosynthesis transcription factor PdxR n=1 Tax=Rhodanobacter sp. MP7CTX1 TaxID=2723084 RepID=UPI00161A2100|nr:PLP-dependent aminotransferase family protein [Rhodanobacter sp. MP7CTX1]MBB6186851.1 GntR family transcriptional regulator/MocR family aminotransferase [Rhodanobacter sp. MP7CTX1]